MKMLYQARVTAKGGRTGHVHSADGALDLSLSLPRELGGTGGAVTNPEQPFAADYTACLENAALHVAHGKQVKLASTSVAATVGTSPRESGDFALTVSLSATLGGVGQATTEALVAVARGVCPYSHVVRGNIDIQLNMATR